ncbi:hypothetical protein [Rhodovulum sulfidophilum]|uniref:hypothetical protein n=1 Tax=Rhodovulum sulfidophilum TaxID=35806 RepID=UPI0013898B00|nr:hypothetical protein [Rhodovulum sulfidophilum]NDK37047.1 hypothetical protein [Rhodovulum sulfidophilum]
MSALVVSASVAIAILAYLNETEKQQRQFTMELAMQYFSGDLQNAKDELFYTIQSVQSAVAPVKLGPADINTYLVKSDPGSPYSERDLASALLAVTSFFNSVSRCVEADLCNGELMQQLLGDDAAAIECAFSGYLHEMAKSANVGNLSTGLSAFNIGDCN